MSHYAVGKNCFLTIRIGKMIVKFKAKENIAVYDWYPIPPCEQIVIKGLYFVDEEPILFTLPLMKMMKMKLIEEVTVERKGWKHE